jgi:Protein of unknown function (DUF433)
MVADGMTTTDILDSHPDLEAQDIRETLHYAAAVVRERELIVPWIDQCGGELRSATNPSESHTASGPRPPGARAAPSFADAG